MYSFLLHTLETECVVYQSSFHKIGTMGTVTVKSVRGGHSDRTTLFLPDVHH